MPIFNNFINKLSQVNLSDINHELGKAKESLVYGTENYFGNFKSDASQVGSLIRSESTKFGSILGTTAKTPASLPKSTSLPVIQDPSPDQVRSRSKNLGSKYKYRSSYCEQDEDDGVKSSVIDEDSIVNKFIKVVGSDQEIASQLKKPVESPIVRSTSLNSREDIRKKLASFGEEETIPEEEDDGGNNNNLEICFINETASDEDEDVMINPLDAHSDEEEPITDCLDSNSISNHNFIPRSKSDWEAFKEDKNVVDQQMEEEKHKIQKTAKVALSQCKQVAKRQLLLEKQKRLNEDPLKKLLGVTSEDINQDVLSKYNINTLQVILNDFREKIEQHSTELVGLLMQKDELETEQDSMLIDIEDISHSSLM